MSGTRKPKSVLKPTDNSISENTEQIPMTNLTKTKENEIMQKEEIKNLPLSKLKPFENHPFKVKQDDDFQKLLTSIAENGVLMPVVARPKENGSYEIISGHRREYACRMLSMDAIPVLVRNLTNEQAVIAMCDSNIHRENILPSEKAKAYKMKLEAIKSAGVQLGHLQKSRDILAQNSSDSSVQIQRYIRLTELIPQLQSMVDEKKIAFNPAVELSYLSKEKQELLLSVIEAEQSTPSLSQAQKFKAMSAESKLTEDSMMEIMREQKCNQKEHLRVPYDKIKGVLNADFDTKKVEELFLQFLVKNKKLLIQTEKSKDKGAR
jgi:ParB family chromosome partitioning protein